MKSNSDGSHGVKIEVVSDNPKLARLKEQGVILTAEEFLSLAGPNADRIMIEFRSGMRARLSALCPINLLELRDLYAKGEEEIIKAWILEKAQEPILKGD